MQQADGVVAGALLSRYAFPSAIHDPEAKSLHCLVVSPAAAAAIPFNEIQIDSVVVRACK